jgi:transposase
MGRAMSGPERVGREAQVGTHPPGDQWLADALVQAAWAAARTKDTYLAAKFRRVAGPKRDPQRRKKAAVAVAHKLLVIAYAIMATPGETYRDLGADHFAKHDDTERRKTRLIAQFAKLGYEVTLTPAQAA